MRSIWKLVLKALSLPKLTSNRCSTIHQIQRALRPRQRDTHHSPYVLKCSLRALLINRFDPCWADRSDKGTASTVAEDTWATTRALADFGTTRIPIRVRSRSFDDLCIEGTANFSIGVHLAPNHLAMDPGSMANHSRSSRMILSLILTLTRSDSESFLIWPKTR